MSAKPADGGLGAPFWRLFASSGVSNLGDGLGRTALPLLAASYTRDPVLVAGLTSFAFVPWLLFAIVSGAVVDRVNRRTAMAVANGLRAVTLSALALLVVTDAGSIVALYVVAFVLGTAETVYDSAARALLPQVVTQRNLDRGNSLLTVEEALGQTFLGAPLGAALFALSAASPLTLNAVGFALAAVLVLSVRGVRAPSREGALPSIRSDIGEGLRWLWGHSVIRRLTLIAATTSLAQSAINGILVLFALEVLRIPDAAYGLLLVAAGVGGLLGGLVAPAVSRAIGRRAGLVTGCAVTGLSALGTGLTTNPVVAAALLATGAGGVMVWNVLTMSLRQTLIPEVLFGRVQGVYRTLVWGGMPLGALLGGVLAGAAGVPVVFVAAGCVLLAASVGFALALRGIDDAGA